MNDWLQTQFEGQSQVYSDPLEALICDEQISLCMAFDTTVIQESWSWRNVHVGRELAKLLFDGQGAINRGVVIRAIDLLEKNLFSLGPGRYHDRSRQLHLLKILNLCATSKECVAAIKRIGRPIGHQGAERLIKETLNLTESVRITDTHARQAALSALLTYLRQNVGSCFATAPAILIQQEQPLQFLTDIGQLIGTGRLLRVFEGKEYVVPLSISWGMGELLRPFSLAALGKNSFDHLALSPGLQAAFEASGFIDSQATSEQKQEQCAALLKEVTLPQEGLFGPITVDFLLKVILQKKCGVIPEDLSLAQAGAISAPLQGLVLSSPFGRGGKIQAVNRYLKAYEAAKKRFKSLTDNALLKAWEFTLASLSESKANFAKWNLYASLGVQPEEEGGIGQSLFKKIGEKIEMANREISECQSRYDHLFAQTKYLEGRVAHATSEREVGWVRAEYQIRRHEINRVLSERDAAYEKGRKFQNLYPMLIEFYGEKIPQYFQEVYDAEMHNVAANPYDDSPAGFRLMYKHGRGNTALWTLIHSSSEFIQYLTAFFVATEIEIDQLSAVKGLEREISELITTVIMTMKRPEFLESAFFRLARAYQEPLPENPLKNLEKVSRKPWAYISGGTMGTLLSTYWGTTQKPKEVKRWVENEKEYLAFIIDSLKELPLSVQKLYQQEPQKNLLAFSPTHAFNLKPGWSLLREAWESDLYTYTWIRDHWLNPQYKFLDSLVLDQRMMERVVEQTVSIIPVGYRSVVQHALRNFAYAMNPSEFREQVRKVLSYEKWLSPAHLNHILDEIDSILYRFLPFFPEYHLRDQLTLIFGEIEELSPQLKAKIMSLIPLAEDHVGRYRMLSSEDLKGIAKGLLIAAMEKSRTSIDYHALVTRAMQKMGLCYPEPFLFADTNWVKNFFGFVVNPGTALLELWRFDEYGGEGRPMSLWKRYLNGTERLDWGLYTHPRSTDH